MIDSGCFAVKGVKMVVQRASVADAEEIASLQEAAYHCKTGGHAGFSIPPLVLTQQQIKNEFNNTIFLKAVIAGRIVGAVRTFERGRTCYVEGPAVHPEFQDEGIGAKLIDEAEKFFSNALRFELFTGTKSKGSIFLYQQLGYRLFRIEDITENMELLYLEKYKRSVDLMAHGLQQGKNPPHLP